jgi:Rhodopirellula transposase DDE domain
MRSPQPSPCDCPDCLGKPEHPEAQYHRELRLLLATLNDEQRRLYAAVESRRQGHGGVGRVAQITGLCEATVSYGRRQLADLLEGKSPQREPHPIGGRPRTEQRYPDITAALEGMLSTEVAGDPMGKQTWVRSSVKKLGQRLPEEGFPVSTNTVWRLLKRMGYSMRTSVRRRRGATRDPAARDEQFRYIASQRAAFTGARLPIISVDTKKKELIGNFRNNGRVWCKEAPEGSEHGFASEAECVATPDGVYDVTRNTGFVTVGLSHNTPEFAVTVIAAWWEAEGRAAYPDADTILILADGGGGNGSRCRAWKWKLQELFCDRFGLKATVCHYPAGCSKWNPVERMLFSQISKNWEGQPLKTLGLMLGSIRGTTTTTGLTVTAHLDEGVYRKGVKVSRDDMASLSVEEDEVCPQWNYTISPRKPRAAIPATCANEPQGAAC